MRRTLCALLVVILVVGALPGTAAAASRTGGTVTVGPGETIDDDLEAVGGTVVVEGTVTGDLEATGGTVVIDGTVEGDVEAAAGTLDIGGTVGGDVEGAGGSVTVDEGAQIGGNLTAGAGSATVDGRIDGNVEIGAEEITLGPTADIRGDLTYDGTLNRADGATVGGTVERTDNVSVNPSGPSFALPTGTFTAYGVVANLVAGAVLVVAFPRFSTSVADDVTDDPLRMGAFGLLALVGVPLVCVLLFLTLVGIPLSIAGIVAYAFLVWAGALYGRFALGRWLLRRIDRDSRWLALLVGVLGVAAVKFVPILGDLVEAVVVLVGLGALVIGMSDRYRSDDDEAEPAPEPAASDAEPSA